MPALDEKPLAVTRWFLNVCYSLTQNKWGMTADLATNKRNLWPVACGTSERSRWRTILWHVRTTEVVYCGWVRN